MRLDLPSRILRFIEGDRSETFDALALAAFRFQVERIEPLARLCEARGVRPDELTDWRRVPSVPASAFRTVELAAATPREVFRSSGTTEGERRSVHHHPYPELYEAVIDATFPEALLTGLGPAPVLSLIPSREQVSDSSLGFVADRVLTRFAAEGSVCAFGPTGVSFKNARSWLGARQRDHRPGVVLATAFALDQLLGSLGRTGLRFRLPPGSRIFETGGFKGRKRQIDPAQLETRLAESLGLEPGHLVREYGMTELTSHFYTRALAGGDPHLFVPPPWTRVRTLDPQTLEPVTGKPGLIAVFDLANVGSAAHLLTEDLGVDEVEAFRLVGRAAGTELRGCSLTVEELTG